MNEALLTYIPLLDAWEYTNREGTTIWFYRSQYGDLAEVMMHYLGIPKGGETSLEWLTEAPDMVSVRIRWR